MPKVTIIVPISRDKFLPEFFYSLNNLICDIGDTALFCYVDGDLRLFEKAHEYVRTSKFTEKLCVYRKKGLPNVSHMASRRRRIADIHNEIKQYIKDCEYIFSTEDDTLLPYDALVKLLADIKKFDNVGAVSGTQLGRWGMLAMGVWKFDNILNPTKIQSALPIPEIESVDACGLYCLLTKRENYMSHNFNPYEDILGPDVDFCIGLRKKGLDNYVDWSINTTHITPSEYITIDNFKNNQVIIEKINDKWKMRLV